MTSSILILLPWVWVPIIALCQIKVTSTDRNGGNTETSQEIHNLLQTYHDYGQFNGTALIAKDGKVLYKGGFGLANFELEVPNQPTSVFRIASVSKQFTAMLAMQLVAEGKLQLHEPIATYLPDYPNSSANKITLHHLLSHTSGIPSYTSFPDYQTMMRQAITPRELVQLFADSTVRFEPGQRFDYSNSGYALIGYIMEKVTGRSYGDLLTDYIFKPLNMTQSGYEKSNALIMHRASGYNNFLGHPASPIDMSVAYAAGGIHSTVEDLFLWDQALYTDKLLSAAYKNLLFEKHTPAWGGHYGYGWALANMPIGSSDKKVMTIEHDGVINGFTSIIVRIPASKTTIILLNNTGRSDFRKICPAILGILHKTEYKKPKIPLAKLTYETIKSESISAAQAFFNKHKDDASYTLDENEMNLFGYELLNKRKTQEAATLFKWNMEMHPSSANTYDSYAEALCELGDTAQAIKYYKKSVYLNPHNQNGIERLHALGINIDKDQLYFINSPADWQHEIFTFPLRFAPDIPYLGKEEAHFPSNWRNPNHSEYWSYAFAWHINENKLWTEDDINTEVNRYYDGLMRAVHRDSPIPPTKSSLVVMSSKDNRRTFAGEVVVFDGFISKEIITLRIEVDQFLCADDIHSTSYFRISPKDKNHEIWKLLNSFVQNQITCP